MNKHDPMGKTLTLKCVYKYKVKKNHYSIKYYCLF